MGSLNMSADRGRKIGMKDRLFSKPIISDLVHELGRQDRLGTLKRIIIWQIASRLIRRPIQLEMAGGIKLLVKRGMHGATKNFYVGLCEYRDMAFAMHYAGPDEILFDVGANVGVYSLIFSSRRGRAIAFEPVPETFSALAANVSLNNVNDLVAKENIGVGSADGSINFTIDKDATNHVVALGGETASSLSVPVTSLDSYSAKHDVFPTIIKIDVEGFETEVLSGCTRILDERASRPNVIIVELNGLGARYGYNDDDIDVRLRSYGYRPCTYDPQERELSELSAYNRSSNTLYVYDMELAKAKVSGSKSIYWSSLSI